ncbi:MAG: hypothetical protein M3032_00845 [Verrucomicrobiota bacterium]|nr:hypothetical protein [Verrucomicrobiota bacterium]
MPFSGVAASSKIYDLRNLLAERFPQPQVHAQARFATGIPALDQATNGGLPRGAITELTSPHPSSGSASMIAALLVHAHREQQFLALIDGRDSFDPGPLGNGRLRHLLWVRCGKAIDAVKAADLLLRDGNFPLVILDLVLNSADELRKIPQTTWYRLQRLAEPIATAFLVLTRRSMISSAQLKLVLDHQWQLPDLEEKPDLAWIKVHVQRMQGGREELAV